MRNKKQGQSEGNVKLQKQRMRRVCTEEPGAKKEKETYGFRGKLDSAALKNGRHCKRGGQPLGESTGTFRHPEEVQKNSWVDYGGGPGG